MGSSISSITTTDPSSPVLSSHEPIFKDMSALPTTNVDEAIASILEEVKRRDPDQPEFYQSVEEVASSLKPLFEKKPKYLDVLRTLVEPERMLAFRVPWTDDKGIQHINRGFRVQFNSALGPYKGGLRLHPTVNFSVVKFLGFEQIFKNALTGLPMGGGKGGSDFNPKGRSDAEVLRFCQSFMTELSQHIGADTDVPAGDIGVGGRELGYLFGQYKRMRNLHDGGVLTGKHHGWGGSFIRPEATGYGVVYITDELLKNRGESLKGKKVLLSGSGNVAQYCAEKLNDLGAIVLSLSDSSGYVFEPEGFSKEQIEYVKELKNVKRGRISEYLSFSSTAKFFKGERPWNNKADLAIPCATQNEINAEDAKSLVKNGIQGVVEAANMPTETDAIHILKESNLIFIPAKAANAGGVATSGLEMSQNSLRLQWKSEEVDEKLKGIMVNIYRNSVKMAKELGDEKDFQLGANAAGFMKVAEAMIAQGQVTP